jgi:hypothetical protein
MKKILLALILLLVSSPSWALFGLEKIKLFNAELCRTTGLRF